MPAPIADGVIMLPIADAQPAPSASADPRAVALEAFFGAARQHVRSAEDRQAVAAHLTDLAAMRAVTAADHREVGQVYALLAVSRQVERQATAQLAAEATRADPNAHAVTPETQRLQALLAGILTPDPADQRWALAQTGLSVEDVDGLMAERTSRRLRLVASDP